MSFKKEWRKSKIGNEIELSYGKGLTKKERNEGKYPVYGSNGITDYHDDFLIEAPGIIVGRKGTIGKIKFSNKNFWPIDTTYYVKLLNENNDLKFWYYFLKIFPLENMNSHSAVPGLNREQVYKLKCLVPPLDTQIEITSIFSSIDKKIKNNNQMNKTLEEMAQSIYKSWFIDFEPFQDKKFNKGKIKEIIEITLGNSPKSDTYNEDGIGLPLLNGASDFNNGRPTSGRYSSKPKRIAKKGEILLCTRGTIGHVSFADKDYCIGRGVSSMKPQDKIYNEYVYFTVKYYLEKLKREAAGSVIRGLTKSDMLNIPIVKCDENIFEEFHNLIKPIINKQLTIIKENQSLRELRDTLLPKLMSGEIRVTSEK